MSNGFRLVWAATTSDEDYVKMQGWRRVVSDVSHRKEVVAGNLGEYASSGMPMYDSTQYTLNMSYSHSRIQESVGQSRGQSRRLQRAAAMGAHQTELRLAEPVRRPVPTHAACASPVAPRAQTLSSAILVLNSLAPSDRVHLASDSISREHPRLPCVSSPDPAIYDGVGLEFISPVGLYVFRDRAACRRAHVVRGR